MCWQRPRRLFKINRVISPVTTDGAMHAGIVEHHNGEGVWILLDHKLVKRLYDRFRRQSVSSRWVLSE